MKREGYMLTLTNFSNERKFFIPEKNIITSDALRECSVGYKAKRFFVQFPSGTKKYVQQYDLSGGLETFPSIEILQRALKVGKIYLTTVGKDYKLRLSISGKGGGSVSGAIAYWITKTVFYSGTTYVVGSSGSIAGVVAGSVVSALTGGSIVYEATIGAVIGGTVKDVVKPTGTFKSGIKETLVMAANVALIENIAMIISTPFTLCPFCP